MRRQGEHGMYQRQIEEVADIEKTYQWLEKAGLKEALIMAAQEHAVSIPASIEAGVYHTRPQYGLEVPRSKWQAPPKVAENDRAKILWDFQIRTDKMMMANQPDILVVDKQLKKVVVIDVAIPSDSNIKKKEHEKLEKYQGLREELEEMWKLKVTVVPVVIGALRAVTPRLGQWPSKLQEQHLRSLSRRAQS
ncbi:hypothetical protein PFLUV_G00200640 [Perca fluviatilis]|uniref:Uncharacterized protein n=1 Tax=Perca fluviatilis TaxID=8168 RepID=A0A6A5DTY4_PERFL|nr:hypothetical protein PFLUV_G00200640 [Perca fluviatilis]